MGKKVKFLSKERNLILYWGTSTFEKFIRFEEGTHITDDEEEIQYIKNSEPYRCHLITEVPLGFATDTTMKTIKGVATVADMTGEKEPVIEQEKGHICEYCGERFQNPNHLKFHLKTHMKK